MYSSVQLMHFQDMGFRKTSAPFFFSAALFAPALSTMSFRTILDFPHRSSSQCASRKWEVYRLKKIPSWPFAVHRQGIFLYFPNTTEQERDSQSMTKYKGCYWKEDDIRHAMALLLLIACHTSSLLVILPFQEIAWEVVCCLPQHECLQTVPATIIDNTLLHAPWTLRLGK